MRFFVMQCPYYEEHRSNMYREIAQLQCEEINEALSNPQDTYSLLLGRQPVNMSVENMICLCNITGKWITSIYESVIIR